MSFFKRLSNLVFGVPVTPYAGVTRGKNFPDLDMVTGDIHMATIKVKKILGTTGDDLAAIFSSLECAENRSELELALDRFNRIMRVFYTAASDFQQNGIIHRALETLGCSQRFQSHLDSTPTLKDAVIAYKTNLVKKLAIDFQRGQFLTHGDKTFDKALLTYHLPEELPEPKAKDLRSSSGHTAALPECKTPEKVAVTPTKRKCSPAVSTAKRRRVMHQKGGRRSNYRHRS